MRYNKVRRMDISNGPGVRVTLFVQGCSFHCKDCFNSETWDFQGGKEYTPEVEEKILEFVNKDEIEGLSVLGGEPLHPKNIDTVIALAKRFKEAFPEKTLWVWSGFLFDDIVNKDILKYADVIVDGPFKTELFNPALKYKGSSNQRVIDVKKTLTLGKIQLYEE